MFEVTRSLRWPARLSHSYCGDGHRPDHLFWSQKLIGARGGADLAIGDKPPTLTASANLYLHAHPSGANPVDREFRHGRFVESFSWRDGCLELCFGQFSAW